MSQTTQNDEQYQSRLQKSKEWKQENKERIKEYRAEYYQSTKDNTKSRAQGLRTCTCGVVALLEEDLELFVKDPYSKHGHRNKCLRCSAKDVRGGTPKAQRKKTCGTCSTIYTGDLEIEENFRRATPYGGRVIGNLVGICKCCEFPEELYYELDGQYILKSLYGE